MTKNSRLSVALNGLLLTSVSIGVKNNIQRFIFLEDHTSTQVVIIFFFCIRTAVKINYFVEKIRVSHARGDNEFSIKVKTLQLQFFVATNGLYGIQCKCPHGTIVTMTP